MRRTIEDYFHKSILSRYILAVARACQKCGLACPLGKGPIPSFTLVRITAKPHARDIQATTKHAFCHPSPPHPTPPPSHSQHAIKLLGASAP